MLTGAAADIGAPDSLKFLQPWNGEPRKFTAEFAEGPVGGHSHEDNGQVTDTSGQ